MEDEYLFWLFIVLFILVH